MIKTENLSKVYSSGTKALENLSIHVEGGEIFGFLGPNGAGKSTTIKILTTLSHPSSGGAWVNGYNVITEPNKVRGSIGYVAQEAGVDYFLTGRENLILQGRMYRMDKKSINSRVGELLELFELKDSADALVSTYSGGMRRKLDIATALIHNPSIIFLDEPTLGLDPHSRSSLWNYIRILNRDLKVTIFLTTHYLDEADKLSNRIGILHKGSMKIVDTPEALKDSIKGDSVNFSLKGKVKEKAIAILKSSSIVKDLLCEDEHVRVYVNNGSEAITGLIKLLTQHNIEVTSLSISRPTLDDVYLKYSGASFKEGEGGGDSNPWWAQWAKKGWGKNWKGGEWDKESSQEGQAEGEGGDWQSGQWTEEEMKAWWSQKENQAADSSKQENIDSQQVAAGSSEQVIEETEETPVVSCDNGNKEEPLKEWWNGGSQDGEAEGSG
ncbi:MAG: ATP-binding cassette domain-containing protein, partial [Nitrospira sp.]|nr:ATP-binding cassette domain-containing protein [Nitrospira sp.]